MQSVLLCLLSQNSCNFANDIFMEINEFYQFCPAYNLLINSQSDSIIGTIGTRLFNGEII